MHCSSKESLGNHNIFANPNRQCLMKSMNSRKSAEDPCLATCGSMRSNQLVFVSQDSWKYSWRVVTFCRKSELSLQSQNCFLQYSPRRLRASQNEGKDQESTDSKSNTDSLSGNKCSLGNLSLDKFPREQFFVFCLFHLGYLNHIPWGKKSLEVKLLSHLTSRTSMPKLRGQLFPLHALQEHHLLLGTHYKIYQPFIKRVSLGIT